MMMQPTPTATPVAQMTLPMTMAHAPLRRIVFSAFSIASSLSLVCVSKSVRQRSISGNVPAAFARHFPKRKEAAGPADDLFKKCLRTREAPSRTSYPRRNPRYSSVVPFFSGRKNMAMNATT
jgi:hypothetical protein